MQRYCFGADIGGTAIKIGLFSEKGDLLEKWEIPTRKEDEGSHILPDLALEIEKKCFERGILKDSIIGVGLDAPGPVSDDGMIHGCVNMCWGEFNFVDEFRQLTGIRNVKAGNDAKVAAFGEHWRGACQNGGSMVLVTLGTGVGGGIVINDKILQGANGAAGEIGHMVVKRGETEYCNCGKQGCLEQYASATGIVRLCKQYLNREDWPSVLRNTQEVTAKNVLDAAKAGDKLAAAVVDEVCRYLGMSLANVSCVVDTDMIVIGGGVSKAGSFLLEQIEKYHNQYAFSSSRGKRFEIAGLGNDAGIYGCARMILEG